MQDKTKLGNRFTCFRCGTKFYDLNRPVPGCPECGEDQRGAPARDIRSILGSGRSRAAAKKAEEKAAAEAKAAEEAKAKEEANASTDDSVTLEDDEDGVDLLTGDLTEGEETTEEESD